MNVFVAVRERYFRRLLAPRHGAGRPRAGRTDPVGMAVENVPGEKSAARAVGAVIQREKRQLCPDHTASNVREP